MQVEATLVEVAVRGVQSEAVYRRYPRELCFVYTRVNTHTRYHTGTAQLCGTVPRFIYKKN